MALSHGDKELVLLMVNQWSQDILPQVIKRFVNSHAAECPTKTKLVFARGVAYGVGAVLGSSAFLAAAAWILRTYI